MNIQTISPPSPLLSPEPTPAEASSQPCGMGKEEKKCSIQRSTSWQASNGAYRSTAEFPAHGGRAGEIGGWPCKQQDRLSFPPKNGAAPPFQQKKDKPSATTQSIFHTYLWGAALPSLYTVEWTTFGGGRQSKTHPQLTNQAQPRNLLSGSKRFAARPSTTMKSSLSKQPSSHNF